MGLVAAGGGDVAVLNGRSRSIDAVGEGDPVVEAAFICCGGKNRGDAVVDRASGVAVDAAGARIITYQGRAS